MNYVAFENDSLKEKLEQKDSQINQLLTERKKLETQLFNVQNIQQHTQKRLDELNKLETVQNADLVLKNNVKLKQENVIL